MQELKDIFWETYQGGQEEEEKERFHNSIILYSKALFALCDIIIYEKLKKLPQKHGERFRILQKYFPDIYDIVDNIFGSYTDAYSKPAKKESVEHIQDGIKKIGQHQGTPEDIKTLLNSNS